MHAPFFSCFTRVVLVASLLAAVQFSLFVPLAGAQTFEEIGSDDFRISFAGPNNDGNVDAARSDVAYNPDRNEYLVVWVADDSNDGLSDEEFEVFGRFLAADGSASNPDFRISTMGGTGDANFDATAPRVAYNSHPNVQSYLVVWQADDNAAPLVNNEQEIFGRVIPGDQSAAAGQFRISVMGNDSQMDPAMRGLSRAEAPAVAADNQRGRFLVAWSAVDRDLGADSNEFDIFYRSVEDTSGTLGTQTQLSMMGGGFGDAFDGNRPAVGLDPALDRYLVVWDGTDNVGGCSVVSSRSLAKRSRRIASLPSGGRTPGSPLWAALEIPS
jgi:hypothetical protein